MKEWNLDVVHSIHKEGDGEKFKELTIEALADSPHNCEYCVAVTVNNDVAGVSFDRIEHALEAYNSIRLSDISDGESLCLVMDKLLRPGFRNIAQ